MNQAALKSSTQDIVVDEDRRPPHAICVPVFGFHVGETSGPAYAVSRFGWPPPESTT